VSRHASLWWPFIIWLLLWIVSAGAYLLLRYGYPEYLLYAAIFLSVLVCGMTYIAGFMASKRRRRTEWDVPFVVITTLVSGMWVVLAVVAGSWSPGLLVFYLIFGPIVVVLWIMRMVMERRDAEKEGAGWELTRGNAAEQFITAAAGVQGHRAEITAANPNYVDTTVNLVESNSSIGDLHAAAGKIAGAAGLPPNAVRFTPTSQAEQVRMRMVLQDTLNRTFPWSGPAYPGETVFAPYPVGVYEDGQVAVKYVADQDGARLQGTFGMTRSGKGNGAREEVGEHITRQETSVTVIDTIKGIQTFGPLADGLDWFILDIPTARVLFRRIMRAVRARYDHLGARRLDAWQPNCGLMFWVLQIEEASHLDVSPDDAVDLAKAMAGAGMRLVWSLQSAQHTQMPVTLRRQLTQFQVYGCNDDFDQDTLPDEVTAGGGSLPSQWMADHPGRNLLIDKGLTMERKRTPLRDYVTNPDQLTQIAREWGSRPLDTITATALGDIYRDRKRPADVVAAVRYRVNEPAPAPHPKPPVASPIQATTAAAGPERDPDDDDDTFEPLTEEEMKTMGVTTDDPAPDMQVDRHRPLAAISPDDDMPVGGPKPPGSAGYVPTTEDTAAIRLRVAEIIDQHEGEGQLFVAPPAFMELVGPSSPTTRSRGWIHKELTRLVDAGRLTFDPEEKQYRIMPDPDRVAATV
jgi:hypothetical protein